MAVDKLVDSTQLDADLTSVANAIRTKGGTSASLDFPADFVTAIAAIPTGGGGITIDDLADMSEPSGAITINTTSPGMDAFYKRNYITSACVNSPSCPTIFNNCSGLTALVVTQATYTHGRFSRPASSCNNLTKLDVSKFATNCNGNAFGVGTALNVLVLRCPTVMGMWGGVSVFNNTPFANGGAGGTIYIPKALYDHLGDGTSSDYKAVTNWATVDGYGTITWAAIEGSQYENYYVDGTPIPSE